MGDVVGWTLVVVVQIGSGVISRASNSDHVFDIISKSGGLGRYMHHDSTLCTQKAYSELKCLL
jgi:hypothetical protein